MRTRGFVIQQRAICDGNDACGAVNREATTSIVGQAVGDSIGGRISIRRERRDADNCSVACVFDHRIRCGIVVNRSRDSRFVNVADGDCEELIGIRRIGGCGSHGNVASCPVGFSIDGPGNRNNACTGINCESSTVIADQRVRNQVRRAIGIIGRSRQADNRANCRVLSNSVCVGIAIGNRSHIEFVDVRDYHADGLSIRSSPVADLNRHAVDAIGISIHRGFKVAACRE